MNKANLAILDYNQFVFNKNLEEVSQEESLVSKQAASCINWIAGHIVRTKESMLSICGIELEHDLNMDEYARKQKAVPANPIKLDQITTLFNLQFELLKTYLSENQLNEEEEEKIAGLLFHEAYHCGQLGLARRLIDKAGQLT